MRRATHGGADRMEGESLAFHRRVIEGFETLALTEPRRFVRVDATGTADEVATRLWDALQVRPAFVGSFGEPGLP
jgi:dTMP kinase